jgi:hypothetical protein
LLAASRRRQGERPPFFRSSSGASPAASTRQVCPSISFPSPPVVRNRTP